LANPYYACSESEDGKGFYQGLVLEWIGTLSSGNHTIKIQWKKTGYYKIEQLGSQSARLLMVRTL